MAPALCPECGAYWPCEHQAAAAEALRAEAASYRPRNRGVMRAFLQRNVEAGTLPADALDLLMPDDEDPFTL